MSMVNQFDIGQFVGVSTVSSVATALAERAKKRRKEAKLSQTALSKRSGVSFASIRRFEETGEISLSSLMKIADALGCLEDFNALFKHEIITDLKDYGND